MKGLSLLKFIDMHCDVLLTAYENNSKDIYELPGMIDVKRLKEAGALAQFFAIFMPPPDASDILASCGPLQDSEYINANMNIFYTTMEKYNDIISPAYNFRDLLNNEKQGKISAFLTFEDGRAIDGKLENLKKYYDKGIRLISLTWNSANCFGAPNSSDSAVMSKGLTDFGKEAVEVMNELGIIIDVSHLSDGGFMDVAKLTRKPFIASHSNCRSLCPHQRNLTDEMIRIISEKGGVAGINFVPGFLDHDVTCRSNNVALITNHIHHMINIGGTDCVALGSDFDGFGGNLEVDGPDKMHLIFEKLKKDGLSEDTIEKVAYKNAERVIKDIML